MINLKELQEITIQKQEKIQEKNKRRKAKFTKKFISKVEKDIKERAKAGCFSLIVRIRAGYWLDEEEFITHFKNQGFSVTTKLYPYAGPIEHYWWDEIYWGKAR